jgi:hypothetical protein
MALIHSPKIVTDNLVLCLDAGNTKSYPDLTGNKFHMDLDGPTFSTVSGVKCFTLDGSNDKGICDGTISGSVEATVANLGLGGTQPKTVVCWANVDGSTGSTAGGLFDLGDHGTNGEMYSLRLSGGYTGWRAQFWSDPDYDFTYDGRSKWTMYSVVYGTDKIGKTYGNNGILLGEDSGSYDLTTGGTSPFTMGIYQSTSTTYYFGGSIAMYIVYDRGLTVAEVKQNYDATKTRFGL